MKTLLAMPIERIIILTLSLIMLFVSIVPILSMAKSPPSDVKTAAHYLTTSLGECQFTTSDGYIITIAKGDK